MSINQSRYSGPSWSGHVVRQSFGERRQWGGSFGPRFYSVCPLPRMWRPEADSRLPADSVAEVLWAPKRARLIRSPRLFGQEDSKIYRARRNIAAVIDLTDFCEVNRT